MRNIKKIVVILVFAFLIVNAEAQTFSNIFIDDVVDNDTAKFSLHINNTNFIKNDEYFNHFTSGKTLIGYFMQPTFKYKVNEKFNLYGGLHLQKYSGIDVFSQILPTFTLELVPNENTKVLFGTIKSTLNHNLTDFSYANEFYLTDNVENGIQFLFDKSRFKTDTWIDWKQFIFKGSTYPEIMLLGTSNAFTLIKKNNNSILDIKVCGIAAHTGGQIDASNVSVETILNSVLGIDFFMYPKAKLCKRVKLFSYLHGFYNASPDKVLKYNSGYGILSGVELSSSFIDIKIQHWYADSYFAKFGNTMFQSITPKYTSYTEQYRSFAITHIFYKYEKIDNLKIGFGLDFYYNIFDNHLDYSYGFYIKSDLNFELRRNKKEQTN